MDKYQKIKRIERMMFVALLCPLMVGGFCYGRFEGDLPDWQLLGLIALGYAASFGIYRLALSVALGKLDS